MNEPPPPMPEVLREVWKITERRGGAVYKTQYLRDEWVPLSPNGSMGTVPGEPDLIYATKSTSYKGPTIRRAQTPTKE